MAILGCRHTAERRVRWGTAGSPAEAAASRMRSCCRTCSLVAWLPDARARSAGEAPQDLAAVHAEAPSGHTSARRNAWSYAWLAMTDNRREATCQSECLVQGWQYPSGLS